MIEGGEVDATVEVGEELCGARSVGVPAAKDLFTIIDAEIGKAGEFFGWEKIGVLKAKLLDDTKEDKVSGLSLIHI